MRRWYLLYNLTAAPMYCVTLSGNPVRDEADNRFSVVDKRPVSVDLITAANMGDTTVTISWYATEDRSGSPLTFRVKLEGRQPRFES